ncbi:hypothetical protein [Actinophytocola gossypii]|uniref:Uncharacterized protein n=1 Tax=Actinophytocola gossypii TaxID=2812003 RepID=A0ABT2JLV6_9PSEU|nr:hypothetical protein [Actinophytocola gossypii]MCT2588264.1 hypothetical protein [Actinophytocola gossypii]
MAAPGQPLQVPPAPPPPMAFGAPPPGGGSRRGLAGGAVAGAVAVAVLAVVAAVTLTSGGSGEPTEADRPAGRVTVYQTTEVPASGAVLPSEPRESVEPEPDDDASALAELQRLRDEDRPEVEALVEQWVPQLSAKRPGLVVNGITYDHLEILRDFLGTQARYPDALLLFSGDYSSFRYGNFWITVVPLPQLDGPAANLWCDAEGIPVDDCYAKMISHTTGYADATELRNR